MAARTTAANGSWSAGATWVGGVAPGIGDTATIEHAVTINTTDVTVGTSPVAGSDVIVIKGSGSLTLVSANLYVRGGIELQDSCQLIITAGYGVEFVPTNAATPSTARYACKIGADHNNLPGIVCNGLISNRCFIRTTAGSATTAYAQLTDGTGWLQAGLVQAVYTDFSRLGDSTNPALRCSPGSTGVVSFNNCTFDSCGRVDQTFGITNSCTYEFVDCKFTNSLDTENLHISTSATITTGTRRLIRNAFDKTCKFYPAEDFTIQSNYFNLSFETTNGDWADFSGNFIRQNSSYPEFNAAGDVTGNYFYYDDAVESNPHYLQVLGYTRDQTIRGNIFDTSVDQPGQDGDCILLATPASACTATITNNLIVRGEGGKSVGTLFSALGNANTSIICNHNTMYTGHQGAAVGETYVGFAGMLQSFKNNVFVSYNGGEGYKLYDSGVDNAVPDIVTSANANYNCGYQLLAGSNLKGYNHLEFSSGSPGANDIDEDPGFVDGSRRLVTWDSYVGGPGTQGDAFVRIAANPTLIASLITWVSEGFYVTNANLENAGSDGTTIGAFPYQSASSMTASPTSMIADSTGNIITVNGVGTSWVAGTPGTPTFSVSGVTGAAITAQTVNNAGSVTLTITASTGGNTGNLVISDGTISAPAITVLPNGFVPVPNKAEYWAYMSEWAGYLNDWFIANNHPANDGGLANTYYDGEMCAYRLKDHFGTTDYDNFIQEGFDAYTTYYVIPNSGSVQGYRNFTDGEREDVIRATSRAVDALSAINLQLLNGSYVASGDVSDSLLSRECAYALECHINAELAGVVLSAPQLARREQLKTWALGHIDQWAINFTAPYFRPFMGALTAKALIAYYTNVAVDASIVSKLKTLADYAWSTCWRSTTGTWGAANSFSYTDRIVTDPSDIETQPDLNILIAPWWGWLYYMNQGAAYRVNGDSIFSGGVPVYDGAAHVSGAYLGTRSAVNPAGKQYDQQLFWGPQYIVWAENITSSSMTVAPLSLTADSVNNTVVVTGVGTTWTPGNPGSPTFSVSGVTGAAITSQVINSATSATLTMTASTGGNIGIALITDGSIIAPGISINPTNPPGGTNSRRRPY